MSVVAPTSTVQDQTPCDTQCAAEQQMLEQKYKDQTQNLEKPDENVRQSGFTSEVQSVPISQTTIDQNGDSNWWTDDRIFYTNLGRNNCYETINKYQVEHFHGKEGVHLFSQIFKNFLNL